ncbi:MAG: helix-turn-helix domain-containing protein [Sporichthyaceae bacterium]
MVLDDDVATRAEDLVHRVRAALAGGAGHDATEVAEFAAQLEPLAARLAASLRAGETTGAGEVAHRSRALIEATRLRGDLLELAVARRFATLPRINESLSRLRRITDVAQLLEAAAAELAQCCGFDRTVVSRRRGSTWQAAAIWIGPEVDAVVAAETRAYLTRQWIPLRPGTLESDLVHRRTAAVIRAEDPRVDRDLVAATHSSSYVASPVMPSGAVIGFLQVDCCLGRRVLTETDRENLWTFAEGFGLIFEHAARVERLAAQRAQVHAAFATVEQELAALSSAELLLVRRELQSLGVADAAPVDAGTSEHALLSRRERDVLELLVTGAGNREIAERLFLGEATVKSHTTKIYRKLGASGRADAISRYLRMMRSEAR